MSDHEQNRHLDALLDSMLSQYSAVEPRHGLELRIHAHLKAHAARRRWRAALAFAASSAIIIAAVVARWPAQRRDVRQAIQRANTPRVHPESPVVSIVRSAHPTSKAPARNTPSERTHALLQLAAATNGNNGLSPDNDLPAAAAEPAEPAASEAEPSATRPISIQKLAVDSLEIKDLAPTKDDEKGNL